MKTTKEEIMDGIESTKSKIVANNTVEYFRPNGNRVIRLHRTDILEFATDGTLTFNSGGYKTVTTKARMNEFQNEVVISQRNGIWYVDVDKPYHDGLKIKDGKYLNLKKNVAAKDEKLLKQIQIYCAKLKKLDKLPEPSTGDCLYCSMWTENGEVWGDAIQNDHLLSHLKEKYIHGSLIMNAIEYAGYINPLLIFTMDHRDGIVRAVRKYFKAKLGLAR